MLSVLLLCAVLGLPIEIDNVLRAHNSSLEILGLAAAHPLDRDIIKRAHRTRVQLCHPDHHCHGASSATCAAANRATMLLNTARDDLLSKYRVWQEPGRPWEATAPSAPWEEPPPSWAGLGVCLTCLACLGSLDCLARFSKRHARRPDPTQSESAGYRWLSLTCSCLARTWPFLWSVLTLLVAPVVSVYGMWMWVSDKRQRAQRAATVRAVRKLRARAFAAGQRGAATPGQKTRAGRSQHAMAHSVERFCRMWSVILAARRHISLLKCRRALATLTARFTAGQFKFAFNGLAARRRRWLLALVLLVVQFRCTRREQVIPASLQLQPQPQP